MKKQILIFCFIVTSFYANTSYAQDAVINIEKTSDLSIEQIFDLIQSNTNYRFVYRHDLVENAAKIQITKGPIKVKELLKKGLDTISCTFEFKDNHTIIVKSKELLKTTDNTVIDLDKPLPENDITIEAIILDKKTKLPVVFANIGFIKKGIGTISNEDGSFKLTFDKTRLSKKEVLQISTLGYKTLKLSLNQLSVLLSKNKTLYLNPEPLSLNEVFITNEKRKEVRLGNSRANDKIIGYWKDKKALGGEIATKINIRKKNTKLLDLKFNVVKNLSDSLKIRVNVYDYTERYPTKKLLTQNIFHIIKEKKGEVTIDLKPYNINADDDIIVSIELVKVYGEKIDFSVSGESYIGIAFKRYISQDKWQRFDLTGMNFSVLTSVPIKRPKKASRLFETDENITKSSIKKTKISKFSNEIRGKVTYQNAPIPDVNIVIRGSQIGTKTDKNGNYSMPVRTGDIIQFSHVSFKTITIVVEDITSTLNLVMQQKTNQLGEAIVTARKKVDPIDELIQIMDIDLKLPNGTVNPYKSGTSVKHLKGEKLNLASPNLASALDGKFSGVKTSGMPPTQVLFIGIKPASYIMNGILYDQPPIDLAQIKDIYIDKIRSFVIIVPYDTLEVQKNKKERIAEQYRNQNYYNNDAVAAAEEDILSSSTKTNSAPIQQKEIFGIITYLDTPLKDVNIKVKGTPKGTKTDAKGYYKITTEIGDELEYSYVGLQKVNIIIEDITAEINIDMVDKANALDEVVITVKNKEGKVLERAKKANEAFETSRGRVDPNSAGYAVSFVDGEEISNVYASIKNALIGKISGYSVDGITGKAYLRGGRSSILQDYPVAWEVDGVFTTEEPTGIDITQVESVRTLKSLAASNKYGTLGAGGVIVITTKYGNFKKGNTINSKIDEEYTNNNYYNNDALAINAEDLLSNTYTKILETFNNKGKAYNYYNDNLKNTITEFDTHISIARKFLSHYNDRFKAINILNELATKHRKDPEILKAIMFNLQAIKASKKALNVSKSIAKLRPNYAQSYRDLANTYKENNDFKMSWRVYINYLANRNVEKAGAIDQIVYNEMEYLYYNRKSQTEIKEQFIPNNESKLKFRNDVRFVAEWNTSEAEFSLEFVGPDKRAYVFEHTLSANQNLITDEKLIGFTSEEFFINDIDLGEWLVNLTYYGNKKYAPTYFKLTTYYHWGKPEQRQEVSVFKLKNTDQKLQLKKVNKELLITGN